MDLKVLYSFLNHIKTIQSPIAFVSITQSITLTFKEKKKIYIYIYKVQEKKNEETSDKSKHQNQM